MGCIVSRLLSRSERLADKFEEGGRRRHIDKAIGLDRWAVKHCLSRQRWHTLTTLASHLRMRYDQIGDMMDIEDAIEFDEKALALLPVEHLNRSISLSNLAISLSFRYKQLGAVDDLTKSIDLDRQALALRPSGDASRPSSLSNLADGLHERYMRLKAIEDLDEAIKFAQEALSLPPPERSDCWYSSSNLSVVLLERCKHLNTTDGLDRAIDLARESLALRERGRPEHPASLNNLVDGLQTRYNHLKKPEDLREAIDLCKDALDLCPPGHPGRPYSLHSLALCFRIRFAHSNQGDDKEEMFRIYSQLEEVPHMLSFADLSAAKEWINVAEELQHPTKVKAYTTTLGFVMRYLAALPSLPQHLHLLRDLTSSLAVDAFSACIRDCLRAEFIQASDSHSAAKAVELLEQGRGVFWGQLNRLRSPVGEVAASGPEGRKLADEFTDLTSRIRKALQSSSADQHDHVCRINVKLQKVIDDIRKLPHFSRFLLPSLFPDLKQAAKEGPVIIVNASKFGCDALIILSNRDPIHVDLSITRDRARNMSLAMHKFTKLARSADMTRELKIRLREIWDEIVSRIVEQLQKLDPPPSRIWWCPTAEFCLLPLHAAGPYRKADQRTVADLYISSYTSSLDALIHARRELPRSPPHRKRVVAIGQAKTGGEKVLQSVGAELANIGKLVGTLADFTSMNGPESCVSRAVEALEKSEWVHLACHGLPNREQPFESAFGMHDGHLTIQRIIQCELKGAEFAYLSACHTTVGYEDGPDEMIHLASAMQFAGFRSVIGTMWAVDDAQTMKITSKFYENMIDDSGHLDYTRAASALHKTMKEVKGLSLDQRILYIHLGA